MNHRHKKLQSTYNLFKQYLSSTYNVPGIVLQVTRCQIKVMFALSACLPVLGSPSHLEATGVKSSPW